MTKSDEESDEFKFDKDRVQIDKHVIMFLPVAAVALNRRPQRRIPGDRPLIVFIPVDHHICN